MAAVNIRGIWGSSAVESILQYSSEKLLQRSALDHTSAGVALALHQIYSSATPSAHF